MIGGRARARAYTRSRALLPYRRNENNATTFPQIWLVAWAQLVATARSRFLSTTAIAPSALRRPENSSGTFCCCNAFFSSSYPCSTIGRETFCRPHARARPDVNETRTRSPLTYREMTHRTLPEVSGCPLGAVFILLLI